jgi:hypothetical protein
MDTNITKPAATDRPTATIDYIKPVMGPDGVEYLVRCWETDREGIYQVHVNGIHIDNIRQLSNGWWLVRGGDQFSLKDHAMVRCVEQFTGLPASKLVRTWRFILI